MDIYLRAPVNKLASVVVNQCGCSSELELNNLLEERAQLKKNLTEWMQQSSSNKSLARKNKEFIKAGNARAKVINMKLKPYDEWHRKTTAKSFSEAFVMAAKAMLQPEVFNAIKANAEELI